MWWLSFVFHEAAFGLLLVLIPLYVVALGGSLTHIGIMSSAAILLSIPASLLWGYLCDKSRRYKPYILLSFLALAAILYALALTKDVGLLIALYVVMAFFHMAHEPSKNVLIAEGYARRHWEKAYAFYEYVTEVGWLAGLLVGFYLSAQGLSASHALMICSALHLVAFILSALFVEDPILILERSLAKIEKSVRSVYKKLMAVLGPVGNVGNLSVATEGSTKGLCLGLVAFFAATGILFTPLPIFLSKDLALKESMVYALFCVNSAGGAVGYFLAGKTSLNQGALHKAAALRCILAFMLIAGAERGYGVALTATTLFLLGLTYAVFHVLSLSLSMEVLPERMAGVFNVTECLGRALGSFVGPLIAEKLGFTYLFIGAGLTFLASYAILRATIKPSS